MIFCSIGYIKPWYEGNRKMCYMDTDSFIVYVKTEDVCADVAKYVKIRIACSNYEVKWTLRTLNTEHLNEHCAAHLAVRWAAHNIFIQKVNKVGTYDKRIKSIHFKRRYAYRASEDIGREEIY